MAGDYEKKEKSGKDAGGQNQVTVRIYGQDYTLASDSGNQITAVADYVDSTMNSLAGVTQRMSLGNLAVYTSINIARDLFDAKNELERLNSLVVDLKKDTDHYVKLWEDAKASFKQYKEEAANSTDQLKELERIYNLKTVELNDLKEQAGNADTRYEKAVEELEQHKKQNEDLRNRIAGMAKLEAQLNEVESENEKLKSELEKVSNKVKNDTEDSERMSNQFKELENNFYDIQMENFRLKNELDELKKSVSKDS